MKIVSFYEMAPYALLKVTTHYPSHRARLDEFHVRGVLLAAGPLAPTRMRYGCFYYT